MEGLAKFREAFEAYSDKYVIIGGTACDFAMRFYSWCALLIRDNEKGGKSDKIILSFDEKIKKRKRFSKKKNHQMN